ncbi:MAG: hypothetical protein KDL10_02275 [Kiritimatiellae bacterium]|nr:hypothetical protein [Kiritimatiellia bacterium]
MNRMTIHVCGVGGVGMSALAEAYHRAGHAVSGSDRMLDDGRLSPTLERLQRLGVALTAQDGRAVTSKLDALVVSTAIEEDNPEIIAARNAHIPVLHRAHALADLVADCRVIAISGTSGKTTVTGMIGYLLTELGLDPKVVNGGLVSEWIHPAATGSVYWGSGDLCVIEVDESDKSLLAFHPELSVLTTVSADHYELAETKALFKAFASQSGRLLAMPAAARVMGLPVPTIPASPVRDERGWGLAAGDGRLVHLRMPGAHNVQNALAALAVCYALELSIPDAVQALTRFRGIHRRLELAGIAGGIRVYDDYAHNPEKIAASWQAAREGCSRVLGYWRPHGYGPLNSLFDALCDTFSTLLTGGDHLYVLPVFFAGGTVNRLREAPEFVAALQARGVPATYVDSSRILEQHLCATALPGDTLLGMGARDPELPEFATHLVNALNMDRPPIP